MIIKLVLPSNYCVHDREKVREFLKSGGIDVSKKVMLYRRENGEYVFCQDTELDTDCDNCY
jgi:hypothetical protein